MFKTVMIDRLFKSNDPLTAQFESLSSFEAVPYDPEGNYPDCVWEADALVIANLQRVDAAFMDKLKNCRVICRCGVGYENVDHIAAAERGIWVANAPAYCDDEVSDHAMSLLLAMERRLFVSDFDMRDRKKYGLKKLRTIRGLRGRTAGIIGLGATGRLTARKLCAFGMDVLYYHPRRHNDEAGEGWTAKWADLETLFKESDYVILHATSTPENYHMVDERLLSLMKPTAGLVNVARGELIDTAALICALKERRIACAGLDVFEGELQSERNLPLFDLENVILTPHSAWLSENAEYKLLTIIGQNVRDAAEGNPPRNCVNLAWMKK